MVGQPVAVLNEARKFFLRGWYSQGAAVEGRTCEVPLTCLLTCNAEGIADLRRTYCGGAAAHGAVT